jgi:putative NADH-flavin reductase
MNLIIFGATGGIGQHLVTQALEAGHKVTAVARRPAAIQMQHPRLTVMQGDVLQPETLRQPMIGQDAVLSSLGSVGKELTTVYSEGVSNIMAAMQKAQVRRIICVSANGLEPGPLWQRVVAKLVLWKLFRESFTDLVRMEAIVKSSSLDWTIMRPPRLTDGPRTGIYQTAINKHLTHGSKISRADLANAMLANITNPASSCAVLEIAY